VHATVAQAALVPLPRGRDRDRDPDGVCAHACLPALRVQVMIGFLFIIGLLFRFALFKRVARSGLRSALAHVSLRYGTMLALGIIMVYAGTTPPYRAARTICHAVTHTQAEHLLLRARWHMLDLLSMCGRGRRVPVLLRRATRDCGLRRHPQHRARR
jgi:hypothetical protein